MSEDAEFQRIRKASAAFAKCLAAPTPSKRSQQVAEAGQRRRAEVRAANQETEEQYRARISKQATEREEKKRNQRGGFCVNGHALTPENITSVGNGRFNCRACLRAREIRKNERRRGASAQK